MDGFDVQAISFVAPAIVQQWKIPISQLGPVFSAALLGLFFGAVVFSQVADKIGRRPVLIGTSMFFSVMCFLTARSNSVGELMTLRFIGGIGMGAIMPNVTALVGEYSPKNSRVTMMMVVTNGFTIGAACAGFLSAWLIGAYGWRSVFYVGGLIPLSIAVLMNFWLPESLQFPSVEGQAVKTRLASGSNALLLKRGSTPRRVLRFPRRKQEVASDNRIVLRRPGYGNHFTVDHLRHERSESLLPV